MFWVNVDKSTKKCVIHKSGCKFERNKAETPLKGIGKLKNDGGWLSFNSIAEAENYCKQEWASKGYRISKDKCI